TWQSLTDVTGDGRPDFLFKIGSQLWAARNRPSGGSNFVFDLETPLNDAMFSGSYELRSSNADRFGSAHHDEVWREAIDYNGDGRVDIIDAREQSGRWTIYLNTPDSGPSGVRWQRRQISIAPLYHHLELRGMPLSDGYLPLSRRFTGRNV